MDKTRLKTKETIYPEQPDCPYPCIPTSQVDGAAGCMSLTTDSDGYAKCSSLIPPIKTGELKPITP